MASNHQPQHSDMSYSPLPGRRRNRAHGITTTERRGLRENYSENLERSEPDLSTPMPQSGMITTSRPTPTPQLPEPSATTASTSKQIEETVLIPFRRHRTTSEISTGTNERPSSVEPFPDFPDLLPFPGPHWVEGNTRSHPDMSLPITATNSDPSSTVDSAHCDAIVTPITTAVKLPGSSTSSPAATPATMSPGQAASGIEETNDDDAVQVERSTSDKVQQSTSEFRASEDIPNLPIHTKPPYPVENGSQPVTPSKSLLARCMSRIDLWCAYPDEVLPRIGRDVYRPKPMRNRTMMDEARQSPWVLYIFLDGTRMREKRVDSADILDYLENKFPGLLSMRRYPGFETDGQDILQIEVKLEHVSVSEVTTKAGLEGFITWLQIIVDQMPFQGLHTAAAGDLDVFWDGNQPADFRNDPIKLLDGFTEYWWRLSCPKEWWFFQMEWSRLATASAMEQQPLWSDGDICLLCKAAFVNYGWDETTTGGAFCCRNCKEQYFEECHACTEAKHRATLIEVPCGHKYDRECLVHCFQSGLGSVHDFPPRCCQKELPIHDYLHILPDEMVRRYVTLRDEQIERKHVICATPACQKAAIAHWHIEDEWALCRGCLDLTCARCGSLKSRHNTDKERRGCPEDDQAVLALAGKRGWKRCPKCCAMVSHNGGCNSMQCRCGQGFCYTCGVPFEKARMCKCPVTFPTEVTKGDDELHELLHNAEDPPPLRGLQRARVRSNEQLMFHCHHVFGPVPGGARCQGCLRFKMSVQQCRHCMANVCETCQIGSLLRRY